MEKEKTGQYAKSYEDLEITDNFLFCKIMSRPEFCKEMIQRLLGMQIKSIIVSEAERQYTGTYESHGIRLDVAAEDNKRLFDVELQTVRKKNLTKRMRYYQSTMDIDSLNHNMDYAKLKETYIIFICDFDQFGYHQPVYQVKTTLDIPDSPDYADGTHKIFINLKDCDKLNKSGLRSFLLYLETKEPQDDYTSEIQKAVEFNKRNAEWRKEYMTLAWEIEYEKREAREIGLEEGRQEGRILGLEEGRLEGRLEGRQEGRQEASVEAAVLLVTKYGISPEQAAIDLSLSEEEKELLSKALLK